MLTVEEVAHHWKLTPETVRRWIAEGRLRASRLNRVYRLDWKDIWACERGAVPSGKTAVRYKKSLLTKDELAAEYRVSIRTVERWVGDGLPTRNVFGSVRFNEDDVVDWLGKEMGFGCSAQRERGFRSMPGSRSLRDPRLLDWS
jgi:excisionase family DNA binding protein